MAMLSYVVLFLSLYLIGNSVTTSKSSVKKFFYGYLTASIVYFAVRYFDFELKAALYTFLCITASLIVAKRFFKKISVVVILTFLSFTALTGSLSYSEGAPSTVTKFGYYHSANNDIFDGLCGGLAISSSDNNNNFPLKIEKNAIPFSETWKCDQSATSYLNDLARLQYSNLAFLADATNTSVSMLTFLLISILSLIFYLNSLSEFGQKILFLKRTNSYIFAAASVFSHLYFVTFINGHIGTLMIAGPLVYLFVDYLKSKQPVRILSKETLLSLSFISLSYPFILPFVFTLILLGKVSQKMGLTKRFWLIFITYFAVLFVGLWVYFSDQRLKNLFAFRSWGSFLTPVSIFQYFGFFPGNVMGSRYLGVIQSTSQNFGITSSLDFLILGSPILIIVFSLIVFSYRGVGQERSTQVVLIAGSAAMAIIVALTSQDSYYFYKVSYVFQFITIGVCTVGIIKLLKLLKVKRWKTLYLTISVSLIFLMGLNILWSSYSTIEMLKRNQSWATFNYNLDEISKEKLQGSVSLIEEGGDEYVTNFVVSSKRKNMIDSSKVKYGLVVREESGLKRLTIKDLTPDTLRPNPAGIYSTEKSPGGNFRWISGNYFNLTGQLGIQLTRINPTLNTRKVRVCTQLADWSKLSKIKIIVTDQNSRDLGTFLVTKEKGCSTFVFQADSKEIFLSSKIVGSYPSLFDRRKILYRLWDQDGTYFKVLQ